MPQRKKRHSDLISRCEVGRGLAITRLADIPGQDRTLWLKQALRALEKAKRLDVDESEENKKDMSKLMAQVEGELQKR
jgi:hypothetical protein